MLFRAVNPRAVSFKKRESVWFMNESSLLLLVLFNWSICSGSQVLNSQIHHNSSYVNSSLVVNNDLKFSLFLGHIFIWQTSTAMPFQSGLVLYSDLSPEDSLPDPAPESPAVSLIDRRRHMLGMKPESMDVPWSHNGVYSPIKQFASTLSAVPVLIYSCVSLRWHWWRRAVDFSSPVSRFNQPVWGAEGMWHCWRREHTPALSPSKRALDLNASSQILHHSPCLHGCKREIHLFGGRL